MSTDTDFFPGFRPAAVMDKPTTVVTIRPAAATSAPPTRPAGPPLAADPIHVVTFTRRVDWFVRRLPAHRRAEIARRLRFRNLPWLRRADDHDPDDCLP